MWDGCRMAWEQNSLSTGCTLSIGDLALSRAWCPPGRGKKAIPGTQLSAMVTGCCSAFSLVNPAPDPWACRIHQLTQVCPSLSASTDTGTALTSIPPDSQWCHSGNLLPDGCKRDDLYWGNSQRALSHCKFGGGNRSFWQQKSVLLLTLGGSLKALVLTSLLVAVVWTVKWPSSRVFLICFFFFWQMWSSANPLGCSTWKLVDVKD